MITSARRKLWLHQAAAIMRIEVKKNFIGRRSLLIYLVALLPIFLVTVLAIIEFQTRRDMRGSVGQFSVIFANIYEALILRTVVFFGCAWVFMNLFRGEVIDRSLHYYFLAPVRREVLVAGKYFSGLLASAVIFSITTSASFFILVSALGFPASSNFLTGGPGLAHAFSYVGITALGCAGYGAVFLVIGLFFRNPIIPALLVYGWEAINFLLPPVLKKISIVHYLHSLVPVPVSEGPFAMIADPTPAWIAIPGLLIVTALVLLGSGLRIRQMEIKYAGE